MFFPMIGELATTDVISVPEDVSVSEVLRQMAQCKVRSVVIREVSGAFGLLTATDVVRLRFSLPSLEIAVGKVNCRSLPQIPKRSNILDVIDQLGDSHGYAAVVDESGGLYGIVSNTDILGSLDPQMMLQRQHLRDLLHRHEVRKAKDDTPLGEVLALLAPDSDAVIVMRADRGVGIVTTHDAIRLLQSAVPLADPVHLHMSTPLHTVTDDLSVGEAVATLRARHFKRLVVKDPRNGEIAGIITQKELIGVAYTRWADLMRHHALELREIISVLERKTAHLEQLATTDPLTGVANRTRFETLLRAEQQRQDRAAEIPFSVILFDVDYFKKINDTWGHNQGDLVLKGLAKHVQDQLRVIDTLARWGGEEFAVLLPQAGLAEARRVAEKICDSLTDAAFGPVSTITASFGVALARAGESSTELLGRADDALYRAKHKGRNRVEN